MTKPSGIGRAIRTLVVDDSRLMRRILTSAIQESGEIEVVGEAAEVPSARQLIKALNPDVITLDVEMPGMDGISFLRKIMELRPTPVIMVSTLTAAGTDATLTALQIGAVDALQKPAGRENLPDFGRLLRSKIKLAAMARLQNSYSEPAVRPTAARSTGPKLPSIVPKIIAIGASTGGVSAVGSVVERLPANMPPIVLTQHMPPMFTARLAERLNSVLPYHVSEAVDGETLSHGMMRIAPGDRHLCVGERGGQLYTRLDDSGPISGHRPSVDVLFNSVASAVGRPALGVILTGMGRDGAAGLKAMRNKGAYCISQDEASSVVYGMPKAARELGAVDEELDLDEIPGRICQFLNRPAAMRKMA